MRSKLFAVLFALYASVASAQSNLPRWDSTTLTQLPSIQYDWNDGAGGDISFGNLGFGIAPDGNLMVSCVFDSSGFAKINAQTGQVMVPCVGPTMTDLRKLHSDPNATTPKVGGILYHNNRVIVSGFITYDTGGTLATHFAGPSLTQLSGPWAPNVPMGFVKAGMGLVPPVFRQALGGPAFATTGYTSIISRASTKPTLVIFDPDQVTGPNFPMTVLMACGDNDPGCRTYGSPAAENTYSGAELGGIGFFIPQTRTFAVPVREGYGPTCYGYATRNQALHGQPNLDAVWCYSLSDPLDTKGPKSYHYGNVFYLYDVNDFIAVKQGTKQPWDIMPYATMKFPDARPDDFITSTTFDPAKGILYVAKQIGGGTNTIYRYGGFPTEISTTPTPTNCIPGTPRLVQEIKDPQCVNSFRTVLQQWTRDGDVQATNGGTQCSAIPFTVTTTEPCVVTPPQVNLTVFTAVKTCRVTIQSQPPDDLGGWGVQFRWDQSNFGSRDSTPPYERARDFAAGTYQLGALWTKTGQTPVSVPTQPYECK